MGVEALETAPLLAPASPAPASPPPISWVAAAALLYFSVGGGPYGFEWAARAFPTTGWLIIGLLSMACLWAAPQGLMVSELAAHHPKAGYVGWTEALLGRTAAGVCAYALALGAAASVSALPSLFVAYFCSLTALQDSWPLRAAVVLPLVGVVWACNLAGLRVVGRATVVFTLCILVPPLVWLVLVAKDLRVNDFAPTAPPPELGTLPGAALLLAYNLTGWLLISNVAHRMRRPARLPASIAVALSAVLATYLVPILAATTVQPRTSEWHDAFFQQASMRASRPLGLVLSAAALLTCLGLELSITAQASASLVHLADASLLPRWIGKVNDKGVAARAVSLYALAALIFSNFSYPLVSQWVAALTSVAVVLTCAAFFAHRRHPTAAAAADDEGEEKEPKFRVPVPCGLLGAAVLAGLTAFLTILITVTAPLECWMPPCGALVLAGAGREVVVRLRRRAAREDGEGPQ